MPILGSIIDSIFLIVFDTVNPVTVMQIGNTPMIVTVSGCIVRVELSFGC